MMERAEFYEMFDRGCFSQMVRVSTGESYPMAIKEMVWMFIEKELKAARDEVESLVAAMIM